MPKFDTLEYLKYGNSTQKAVYRLLTATRIIDLLRPFDPVVVGTIPLEINVPGSDIDLICCCKNDSGFKSVLSSFEIYQDYELIEADVNGIFTIICRFSTGGFPVEIFAQNRPVREQEAYRHMLIEYNILQQRGDVFKKEIIRLKQQGLKTEPAFALLLGLQGDPYRELLSFRV